MPEILICRIERVIDRKAAAALGNASGHLHVPEEETTVAAGRQYPQAVADPDHPDILSTYAHHAGTGFAKTRYTSARCTLSGYPRGSVALTHYPDTAKVLPVRAGAIDSDPASRGGIRPGHTTRNANLRTSAIDARRLVAVGESESRDARGQRARADDAIAPWTERSR